MPSSPGIQFASTSLMNQFKDSTTAPSKLARLVCKTSDAFGKTVYYQASYNFSTDSLFHIMKRNDYIEMIEMPSFSAITMACIVGGIAEIEPANILIKCFTKFSTDPEDDDTISSIELIGFNVDDAFSRGAFDRVRYLSDTPEKSIQVANVLFILPQMEMPIDPMIKGLLMGSRHAAEQMVSNWLREVYEQNLKYSNLQSCGFNDEDLNSLNLPVRLRSGSALYIYKQVQAMKTLVAADEYITHSALLSCMHPKLGEYFSMLRKDGNNSSGTNTTVASTVPTPIPTPTSLSTSLLADSDTSGPSMAKKAGASLISGSYDEYDTYGVKSEVAFIESPLAKSTGKEKKGKKGKDKDKDNKEGEGEGEKEKKKRKKSKKDKDKEESEKSKTKKSKDNDGGKDNLASPRSQSSSKKSTYKKSKRTIPGNGTARVAVDGGLPSISIELIAMEFAEAIDFGDQFAMELGGAGTSVTEESEVLGVLGRNLFFLPSIILLNIGEVQLRQMYAAWLTPARPTTTTEEQCTLPVPALRTKRITVKGDSIQAKAMVQRVMALSNLHGEHSSSEASQTGSIVDAFCTIGIDMLFDVSTIQSEEETAAVNVVAEQVERFLTGKDGNPKVSSTSPTPTPTPTLSPHTSSLLVELESDEALLGSSPTLPAMKAAPSGLTPIQEYEEEEVKSAHINTSPVDVVVGVGVGVGVGVNENIAPRPIRHKQQSSDDFDFYNMKKEFTMSSDSTITGSFKSAANETNARRRQSDASSASAPLTPSSQHKNEQLESNKNLFGLYMHGNPLMKSPNKRRMSTVV